MVDRKSKINYSLDLLWYYNNMLEYNNYLINNGNSYFSCVFFNHIFGLWKVLWLSSNAIKKNSSTKIIHRFYAIFTNLCFTLSVSIELFLKGVFAWVLSFSNEGKSSTFFQKKYMSIKRSYSQHLGRYRWYSFAFFSSCYSLNLEFLEQKSVIWQDRFLLVIVNILFITKGLFGCLFYWVVSSVESSESILIESKNKKDKFIQIQIERNNDFVKELCKAFTNDPFIVYQIDGKTMLKLQLRQNSLEKDFKFARKYYHNIQFSYKSLIEDTQIISMQFNLKVDMQRKLLHSLMLERSDSITAMGA